MGLMGLAHAYLIWSGDVLTRYTMCAAVLCLFRKLSPKWLLLLAIVFHLIYAGITLEHGWQIYQLEGAALESRIHGNWEVSNRTIQHFLDTFRGGYKDQMSLRFFIAYHLEVRSFFFHGRIFQVGAMMLLGMALFKWGVLSGEGSKRLYRYLIGIGLFVGIPLTLLDIIILCQTSWDYQAYSMFCRPLYLFSAPLIALMWISIMVLWIKSGKAGCLTRGFSAAGQLALTNYLMQSILGTLFFYGHGLGWYGYLERYQQFLFVFTIWIIQLMYSVIWLCYFQFGPFEWLWRSLTYLKFQPLKRQCMCAGNC